MYRGALNAGRRGTGGSGGGGRAGGAAAAADEFKAGGKKPFSSTLLVLQQFTSVKSRRMRLTAWRRLATQAPAAGD